MNNPNLSEMINDDDEGAFQYLSNLVVVDYEDVKSGYKISFVRSSLITNLVTFVVMGVVTLYILGVCRRDWITLCLCACMCVIILVLWGNFFPLEGRGGVCIDLLTLVDSCDCIHSTSSPIPTSRTRCYRKR